MRVWFAALALIVFSGCAGSYAPRDYASSRDEIERLEQRIEKGAGERDARVALGQLLISADRPALAEPHLRAVLNADSVDAEARLYLGLALEGQSRFNAAEAVYASFIDLPTSSPYRQLLGARHAWIQRTLATVAIRSNIENEGDLQVSEQTIAVLSYQYRGSDPDFEVLSRGMAELMSTDLANVAALRVVERVRLQALLDELALAENGLVDQATAPRAGRLLGAGRMVTGAFDVRGDRLDIETSLIDVNDAFRPALDQTTGALGALFRLQKETVFDLLDRMGVVPTADERTRIEFIPTENLQAFLAYSRGLRARDDGRFQQAAGFFRQAADLDAGFTEADNAANQSDISDASARQETSAAVAQFAPAATMPMSAQMVDERLVHLLQSIDGAVLLGDDDRDAAEETGTAAPATLPLPPPPPAGGN